MSWPTTSRHERGYGTAWDKLRLIVLARDNSLCQCIQCQGGKIRVTRATEVHHIVSKAQAAKRRWTQEQIDDMGNLMSINRECHKRETMAEQGKAIKQRIQIGADGWPENATK